MCEFRPVTLGGARWFWYSFYVLLAVCCGLLCHVVFALEERSWTRHSSREGKMTGRNAEL
jgi:hypothetical protein